MADADKTLLTIADLGTKSPGLIIDAATGRKALTFAGATPVEVGTTGDRNITSLCTNLTAGTVELIRTGYTCTLSLSGVKVVSGANISLLPNDVLGFMYLNFRIGTHFDVTGALVTSDRASVKLVLNRNGGLNVIGATSTDTLSGTLTWTTQRGWPSSLPGLEGPMGA